MAPQPGRLVCVALVGVEPCGLAGCWIEAHSVIAGVVVVRLPHKRVDYYEVITDAEKRLGLKIRTLPLAILLAAVGNPTLDFVELVINGMTVSSQVNTLSEDLGKLIGPTQDPEQLGVVPAK